MNPITTLIIGDACCFCDAVQNLTRTCTAVRGVLPFEDFVQCRFGESNANARLFSHMECRSIALINPMCGLDKHFRHSR